MIKSHKPSLCVCVGGGGGWGGLRACMRACVRARARVHMSVTNCKNKNGYKETSMKKSAVTLDKKGGTTHSVLLMGSVAVGGGGWGGRG